jgi:hypothetical protein
MVAAVTWRARIVAVDPPEDDRSLDTLGRLSRGRLAAAASRGAELAVIGSETGEERWLRSAFPESRVAWKDFVIQCEAEGIAGIVLPNDPRLLDLLRNPDVTDDRSDLKLAFG